MRYALLVLPLLVGVVRAESPSNAKDQPPYVSSTFREIQSRVSRRHKETDAIQQVKTKEDAPYLHYGLLIRIEKQVHQEVVTVKLYRKQITGDDIFEEYQLKMDDAIRLELNKLAALAEWQVAEAKRIEAEETKQIQEATKGVLKYGMSKADVERIKGKPLPPPAPQPGAREPTGVEYRTTRISYPDMILVFKRYKLRRVELVKP